MAIPENSGQIVAIVASLAMLTPLVKALHRWHIDIRKTSKASKNAGSPSAEPVRSASHWSQMTLFDKLYFSFNSLAYFTSVAGLFILCYSPVHPATSREVATVGILVMSSFIAGRALERI